MLAGRAGEIVSRRETPSQCGRVGSPASTVRVINSYASFWLVYYQLSAAISAKYEKTVLGSLQSHNPSSLTSLRGYCTSGPYF